jgi:outer membrane protein TolC
MEEAIEKALVKNNLVRSSEFALNSAEWNTKHAWTLLFPTLKLNSRFTRIDQQSFAERDFRRYFPPELASQIPQTVFQESYFTSLDVTAPIFNGSLINNLSVANASEDAALKINESTRENIIFQVISSYLSVLKSKEVLNIQKDYLDLSRLNYEKAERLYKANRYSKTEALRWKVEFQQQKSIVVSSESQSRSDMTILNRLINEDMFNALEVEKDIPTYLLAESERLQQFSDAEILDLIKLNDDELTNVNKNLSAAKSNEEVSWLLYKNSFTSYLPDISLSYSYGWRENNTLALDDYSPKTLMINFSIPIFTSFQNFTSLKSTYYDYKQNQEQFFDQLQNTKYILTETSNKLIRLKTQRELSKTNVEYNEHNYRIVETQKERGLVSNIDFIDAKLNLQNAKLDDINNHYDFISAMVELYYLLGKIESVLN